jgi:hypothetical protein
MRLRSGGTIPRAMVNQCTGATPPRAGGAARARSGSGEIGSEVRCDKGVAGATQKEEAGSLPRENLLMAVRPKDTWYVSFEDKFLRPRKRAFARATETFRSEFEAKEFARKKLADNQSVSAGTLNPHQPKRLISSAQLIAWLEEP